MSFAKFCAMLNTSSLYFCSADRLGDPYEGSMSLADKRTKEKILKEEGIECPFEDSLDFFEFQKKWTFVSCWHESEFESAALYDVYGTPNQTIAVQSTVGRLMTAIYQYVNDYPTQRIIMSRVRYIDYIRDNTTRDSVLAQFFQKSHHFRADCEMRVMIQELPFGPGLHHGNEDLDIMIFRGNGEIKLGIDPPDLEIHYDLERPRELGRSYPIELDALIENAYVDYRAEAWFLDMVVSIAMERFGCTFPIRRSKLAEPPFGGFPYSKPADGR